MVRSQTKLFISKDYEGDVFFLREKTKSVMAHVQKNSRHSLADDLFQYKVISQLDDSLSESFRRDLAFHVSVWTSAKSSIINRYFHETEGTDTKKYLRVAVMCNSKGGLDVLSDDLEQWVENLARNLKDKENRKYLSNIATKKQVVSNLARMIVHPASIKITEVNAQTVLTEDVINSLLLNSPDEYIPEGAKIYVKNGGNLDEILSTTSSMIRYNVMIPGEKVPKEIEELARVKSQEAYKVCKFIVGIRDEAHADGAGDTKKVPSFAYMDWATSQVTALRNPKIPVKVDYRYPQEVPRAEVPKVAEAAIMNLLKVPYFDKLGKLDRDAVKAYRSKLIYGNWVDINFHFKQGPFEVQIKDPLGDVLYRENSPFGHNGEAYADLRASESLKQVNVLGVERPVDIILDYLNRVILLPAYKAG